MELLENLKKYNEASYDIAEKLIELANMEDDGKLGEELLNALYQVKATAQNPYNSDYWRVLYNVLLAITGLE